MRLIAIEKSNRLTALIATHSDSLDLYSELIKVVDQFPVLSLLCITRPFGLTECGLFLR